MEAKKKVMSTTVVTQCKSIEDVIEVLNSYDEGDKLFIQTDNQPAFMGECFTVTITKPIPLTYEEKWGKPKPEFEEFIHLPTRAELIVMKAANGNKLFGNRLDDVIANENHDEKDKFTQYAEKSGEYVTFGFQNGEYKEHHFGQYDKPKPE